MGGGGTGDGVTGAEDGGVRGMGVFGFRMARGWGLAGDFGRGLGLGVDLRWRAGEGAAFLVLDGGVFLVIAGDCSGFG